MVNFVDLSLFIYYSA